ncbi:alcohol dehydrogenase catalytic domain-containing protein [Streptomyces coeruleorubidus]
MCRTDLHVVEGDLPVRRAGVTPGHQVVGVVAGAGATARGFAAGDRVGVASRRRTDGGCAYCAHGAENLRPRSECTGWERRRRLRGIHDGAGGVPYRLPDGVPDVDLDPPAVRGHHRLPGAAASGAAARRTARAVRLRGQRPSARAGWRSPRAPPCTS